MNKYLEISNKIREDILVKHKYLPGGRLPCETELCHELAASKMTVKKALDILVEEGLILKKRGSGTYVKGLSSQQMERISNQQVHPLRSLLGFTKKYGRERVSSAVLEFSVLSPTREIAANLQIEPDDFVYKIIRIRKLDGQPWILEETYMPIGLMPGLKVCHAKNSIYDYIRNVLGYEIQSSHVSIRIRSAEEKESELMKLPLHEPVAVVEQLAFLNNGRPFEFSRCIHSAENFEFTAVLVNRDHDPIVKTVMGTHNQYPETE